MVSDGSVVSMGTLMTPAAAPRSMVTLVPPPSEGGDIGCGPIGVTCNGTAFSGCVLQVLMRQGVMPVLIQPLLQQGLCTLYRF